MRPRPTSPVSTHSPSISSLRSVAVVAIGRESIVGGMALSFPLGASVTLAELERRSPSRARAAAGAASRSRGCRRSTRGSSRGATSSSQAMRDPGHVHRRRPALLDGPGRRPEHALARRRGAPPPPRPLRAAVSPRRRPRALRRRWWSDEVDALLDRDRGARRGGPARASSPGRSRSRRWCPRSGSRRRIRPRRSGGTRDIVAEVTAITTGERAGRERDGRRSRGSGRPSSPRSTATPRRRSSPPRRATQAGLGREQVASNAAVLLFGGIETTEAMIANAFLHLLVRRREAPARARDPRLARRRRRGVAAARAGGRGARPLCDARHRARRRAIAQGDLVTLSLAGANRDPEVFPDPDRFDPEPAEPRTSRSRSRTGRTSVSACTSPGSRRASRSPAHCERLPGLRLDPARPAAPRASSSASRRRVHVLWDTFTP